MPEPEQDHSNPPDPADHLRTVQGEAKWIRSLAPTGLVLLIVAALVTVLSPSAIWFLVYPVLIVGALWALTTAAAFLLRHF
jgi:hypothetical protein